MGSPAEEGNYAARVIRDTAKALWGPARVMNDLTKVMCAHSSARTRATEAACEVARARSDVTVAIFRAARASLVSESRAVTRIHSLSEIISPFRARMFFRELDPGAWPCSWLLHVT